MKNRLIGRMLSAAIIFLGAHCFAETLIDIRPNPTERTEQTQQTIRIRTANLKDAVCKMSPVVQLDTKPIHEEFIDGRSFYADSATNCFAHLRTQIVSIIDFNQTPKRNDPAILKNDAETREMYQELVAEYQSVDGKVKKICRLVSDFDSEDLPNFDDKWNSVVRDTSSLHLHYGRPYIEKLDKVIAVVCENPGA